jgi:glycosyltransferase involved in cell wall biosynthesis
MLAIVADRRERRVCLVLTELLGAVKNGGLGTASSYLALALAADGHRVEVLDCTPRGRITDDWRARYHAAGVQITRFKPSGAKVDPGFLQESFDVYQQLRADAPDVVAFSDWRGLGYCSARARQLAIAFEQTLIVHYCHGSTQWVSEANKRPLRDTSEFGRALIERLAVELSDVVVSPSQYLIDWMRRCGWDLPNQTVRIPYFTEGALADLQGKSAPERLATVRGRTDEIVFFGRLEERKGIRVFVDALSRVDPSVLEGRLLTFLGREDKWTTSDVRAALPRRVRAALADVSFQTNLDQTGALTHLRRPGVLAVIPSLLDNSPCVVYECIENGVPFIASDAGGTGEILAECDRSKFLFAPTPTALSDALTQALDRNGGSPRKSFTTSDLMKDWRKVIGSAPIRNPSARGAKSTVSVIVTHHERPALVERCLHALERQSTKDFDVILVDDGSGSTASRKALARFEERDDWPWPFRVIRQENAYLGAARNTGWRAAEGDTIIFVDDDDVPFETMIDVLVNALAVSGADVVTCGSHMVSDDIAEFAPKELRYQLFLGEPRELGVVQNLYGAATAIYRKSLLERIGGFHERHGLGYEDWRLFAQASLDGARIASVPEPLMRYAVSADGMLNTMPKFDSQRAVLEVFEATMPPTLRFLPGLASYRGLRGDKPPLWSPVRIAGYARHGAILARRSRDVIRSEGFGAFAAKTQAWLGRRGGPR